MTLRSPALNASLAPRIARHGSRSAIALVVTLLMLSVITFLAVAFLAVTRRDTSGSRASLDVSTAKSMSEAALARAQAEIVARMMAQTDILAYDYLVSTNYQNPSGFVAPGPNNTSASTTNVNYDWSAVGASGTVNNWTGTRQYWAQNIANLYFDPRPPVFVNTNTDPSRPTAYDFRYYIDLNRNGLFEGSFVRQTDLSVADKNSGLSIVGNTSGQLGEPEWIGVLADPTRPHAPDNPFIGRYAFMILPIGKTLDLNYIHNELPPNVYNELNSQYDMFSRDQGVGTWELNLAAYLRELNTNSYDYSFYVPPNERYQYLPPDFSTKKANGSYGYCFDDALFIVSNRIRGELSLQDVYGTNFLRFQSDGIDAYGSSPITNLNGPFDFTSFGDPESINSLNQGIRAWPGSYVSNQFYDMQDVFDPRKTGPAFVGRLATNGGLVGWNNSIGQNAITYDRYTYQRMLATMGTGSEPEYGCYVYADGVTTLPQSLPTLFRTKMNLNYDNTQQMIRGPYSPMPTPTNLVAWGANALGFFTNAADLLLRTQEFPITNYASGQMEFHHFGLSTMANNYPIYCPTNPSYRYDAQLHRMLQIAANLYEAQDTNGFYNGANLIPYPAVFRPIFYQSNDGSLYITNYARVTTNELAAGNPLNPLQQPWKYMTNPYPNINPNDNIYGVPWVVGTVKGLPQFNEMQEINEFGMTRKLQFIRPDQSAKTTLQTNQMYEFSISNRFGIELWNPYTTAAFTRPVYITASNRMSIIFTNNSAARPCGINITNVISTNIYSLNLFPSAIWPSWDGNTGKSNRSMLVELATNNNFFPLQKYLDSGPSFYDPANQFWDTNSFTVHHWRLYVTNTLTYIMQDTGPNGAILDFVNLGPAGSSLDVLGQINATPPPMSGAGTYSKDFVWRATDNSDVYPATSPAYLSAGELNQIHVGMGLATVKDWNAGVSYSISRQTEPEFAAEQSSFADFLTGGGTNTVMSDPFQPTVVLAQITSWQANDPMVHYTAEDLTRPGTSNYITFFNPTYNVDVKNNGDLSQHDDLGEVNNGAYLPWPNDGSVGGSAALAMMGRQDPEITKADDWQFPTNRFPNVGWIGRVHRGTPWQTIFLKADPAPQSNPSDWLSKWVGDLSPGLQPPGASYPTNDWGLLDLFTTAPIDNALRGTLSVNQTNTAPWHALIDGVIALTVDANQIPFGAPIDPTQPYQTYPNIVSYMLQATNTPDDAPPIFGINLFRTNQVNGVFHHIGDILQSPTLTTSAPWVNPDTATDEMVERIPQQVASLLKVGYPQFVIYSWGQALRPKDLYNANPPALFGLCTNYAITGEFLTRTVCHLDLTRSDRFATNAHIQVDSFNILPAAQ